MAGEIAADAAHRWRAAVIGGIAGEDGRRVATRAYPLGCARDEDGVVIVGLIRDVPGVGGMTFEADDFDHAFRRAIEISEDMADVTGHLRDGVLVSLVECDSLAEIGVDTD